MGARPRDYALTTPGKLRLYSTRELIHMPPPKWQIHGILPAGGLVGLYAPPGVGKTFLAIDMALAIAADIPWHGHAVTQGPVLYISAEGGTGIGKRVSAWLRARKQPDNPPVMWLTESLPVYADSDSMDQLMHRVLDETDLHPTLTVIDTLARCFDGDENQQEDMGRFVGGVDRLRREFNSTVLIVHHTRLDGDRERGNTAFRGAADTMLYIERDKKHREQLSLRCNKQKDAEEFTGIPFTLVEVPEDDSCVVQPHEVSPAELVDLGREQQCYAVLAALGPLTWNEWMASSNLARSTFNRVYVELKEKGKIIRKNSKWQVEPAD